MQQLQCIITRIIQTEILLSAEAKLRWIILDHAKPHPKIVLLYIQKYCSIMKKLKQLTMQNYLYLKFPLANLKPFSGVLVAKILLENVLIQTFSAFAIFF